MKKIVPLLIFIFAIVGLQASAQQPEDYFITTWQTTSANETITIPTQGIGYDYSVDWGDGFTDTDITSHAVHTYAASGTHEVKIYGDFPRIYFNNNGDKLKIKSIDQWGDNAWTSMKGAFEGCKHLVSIATDTPNFSMVTDMQAMFAYAEAFNGDLHINDWDVSGVTNMEGMFGGAFAFNADIGNWNVGNVTNMKLMFAYAKSFNQDIGDWTVGSVFNMDSMFRKATIFDQDLGDWNVSSVVNMKNMFKGATLSTANYDALLIGWNAQPLQSPVTFNGGNSTYCAGEAARDNMINTLGWTIIDGGIDCSNDPNSFVTTWQTTTANETITIPTTGSGYNYSVNWGDGNISMAQMGSASHVYATAGLHTVIINGDFPRIYFNNSGDREKIQSIKQWGTNSWGPSMKGAFEGCTNLVSNATDTPDFSSVTNMQEMFAYAEAFNGDVNINDWDVSSVTTMHSMFGGASSFNAYIGDWNVGSVTNMKLMFAHAIAFEQGVGDWDVSHTLNMASMFRGASSFNEDLSNWNVSNVSKMKDMFKDVTLSTANYDALLIGWSSQSLQSSVTFSGGNSTYCAGEAAKQDMIDSFSWNITDGGRDCSDPCGNITEYTAGGWSNGSPTVSNKAVFASDYITAVNGGSIEACGIVINAGVTVIVSGGTTIRAEYNMEIDTTGNLIFESTATANGELGILGPDASITGDATVQRYLSANSSYRMVSPAVTTTTSIMENWQEGVHNISTAYVDNQNPNPGYGTHITGSSTGAHGFDATMTGNPSMSTVDVANQQFQFIDNTDTNTLTAGEGYLMYIRGDRSINLTESISVATETVLRATGKLVWGPQPQTFTSPSNGALVMFGNPYQSAVDVRELFGTSSNVNSNFYYVYDPNYGAQGAYITVDLNGGPNVPPSDANEFLQPGQAAQLVTLEAGPVLVDFQESYKRPGEWTNTNATGNTMDTGNMLTGQLYTQENYINGGSVHDGFAIRFAHGNNNALTSKDAVKPMNLYENIGIDHDATYLSIEEREMPQPAEVYSLFSSGYTHSDYTLTMTIDGLEDSFLYLDDNFTGTSTLLEAGDTVYNFSVDANDELSIATDRFSVRVEERLGVNNNDMLTGIRLYPNPISDNTFYINAPKLNGEQVEVNIADMAGRQIYNNTLNCQDNRVAVSVNGSLTKGVYLVNLKYAGEENTYRLVKQ